MSTRIDGYVVDTTYTYQHWNELAPSRLAFAATMAGRKAPDCHQFKYLELGCGQGLSINILSALYPHGEFVGVDINSEHIANANTMASEAKLSNATFVNVSFKEFYMSTRDSKTKYDYIVLHGVYTWVNVENRNKIIDIIDESLKPGGIVYISYNAMPGGMARSIVQRLLMEYAVGSTQSTVDIVVKALKFSENLSLSDGNFFKQNTQVKSTIIDSLKMEAKYLSHEYMHEGWSALYFSDVATAFEKVGMFFLGSCRLKQSDPDGWNLPSEIKHLAAQKDGHVWRETLRDYTTGSPFRVDLFQKDPHFLSDEEQRDALKEQAIVSRLIPNEMSFSPEAAIYANIKLESFLQRLEQMLNSRAYKIAEILDAFHQNITFFQLIKIIRYLLDNKQIELVTYNTDNVDRSIRLNNIIMKDGPFGKKYNTLCSPVLSNGFATNHLTVLAIQVLERKGELGSYSLALAMRSILEEQNHLLYDGRVPIHDPVLQAAEIAKFAERFPSRILPVLKRFGVV